MPPRAAKTGVAARRAELNAPPGAVASTTSFVASAKKKTIPTSLTRKRDAPVTRAYDPAAALAQIDPTTAPAGNRSDRSIAMRTKRRISPLAFSAAADLQADRRADEAEAVADLIDEKPLVGKMKRGRDVREEHE